MAKIARQYKNCSLLLALISLLNVGLLPNGIIYVFFLLFCVFFLFSNTRNDVTNENQKYVFGVLMLFAFFTLNYFVSEYKLSFFWFLFASFVTVIPFITFIVSEKICFSKDGVVSFCDGHIKLAILISFIIIIETLLFPTTKLSSSLLSSQLFMLGYVTSYLSICAMLCLGNYSLTKEKKYVRSLCFLAAVIFLSMQLKALAGIAMVCACYMMIMLNISRISKIFIAALGAGIVIVIIALSPTLNSKISEYKDMYGGDAAREDIARVALYYQSVEMAKDCFPFGTGQGTFGSIPAKATESRVYDDYDLSNVYGLSFDGDVNFMMDTHWASVLGEQGFLGSVLYIILFLTPVFRIRKIKCFVFYKRYITFIVLTCYLVLIVESIALPLINRLCFTLIYSGLCSIITSRRFITTLAIDR